MFDEILSSVVENLAKKPIMKVEQCPHCGYAAILVKNKKHKKFPYFVKCLNIFCSCKTERCNDADLAVRTWNKRAIDAKEKV